MIKASKTLTVEGVIIRFPALFTPTKPKNSNDDTPLKYNASFIVIGKNKKLIAEIQKAQEEVVRKAWGDQADSKLKQSRFNLFIRPTTEVDYYSDGDYFFGAATYYDEAKPRCNAPTIVDSQMNLITQPIDCPDGSTVNVKFTIRAYTHPKSQGLTGTLNGVQVVKAPDFVPGNAPDDLFTAVEGGFTKGSNVVTDDEGSDEYVDPLNFEAA